jgi:hypothetical protein
MNTRIMRLCFGTFSFCKKKNSDLQCASQVLGRCGWALMAEKAPPPPLVEEPAMFDHGTRGWFLRRLPRGGTKANMTFQIPQTMQYT